MKCAVLGVLFLGLLLVGGNDGRELRSISQIHSQFVKYVKREMTYTEKSEFRKVIDILAFSQYILRNSYESFTRDRQSITCIVCRAAVDTLIEARRSGTSREELTEIGVNLCTLMQIQPARVCQGVVELNIPIFIHMIDNVLEISGESFCGVLLQTDEADSCSFEDDRFAWSVDIPPKVATKQKVSNKAGDPFKVVHISDIHYDPAYEAYGLADCDEPTCCRVGQLEKASPRQIGLYDDSSLEGRVHIDEQHNYYIDLDRADTVREARKRGLNEKRTTKNASLAGYWGDYRSCDTPWWGTEDGIDHIVENHQGYNYVYYTGDTIDHGVWETTYELVTNSIIKTTQKLKQAFGDVPVYQVIGNHESQPTNQFAPGDVTGEELNTHWLYDLLWDQWKQWLPAEAEVTLKKGGYYTVVPEPGFRIVVLNSNLCYRYNWWVQYDPIYPKEQLDWMVEVLLEAEAKNEMVHVLSHIPPGVTDCFALYTREYKRIIERFADIIKGEFNGHTHKDEFKVFYSKENNQPLSVAWNGGSLTAYSNVNPNYRLYDVNSSTFDIIDMETWVYNLTEANLTPNQRPRWFMEYRFTEHYNVSSASPDDLDGLLERFVTTDQDKLVTDYHRFRGKYSDPFVNRRCDDNCVRNNLRYLTVTELYDNRKFQELHEKYLSNKQRNRH